MNKWVKANLSDVTEITMGQSPDSASYNELGDGYPFLQGCADFGKRYPKARIFCSDAKKIGRKDSVLISVRAPVGELNLADKDYCVGRGVSAIYPRKINRDFLFNSLLLNKRFFYRVSQGSTFEAINSNDLNSFNIDYPDDIAFQNKIARILNTVDVVIEQTELTTEKLKSIKQGMMHDLFTRGIDVKTGQLRPPQFEEPELYKNTELGWIPKDWEYDDLERFSSFAGGNGFSELLQGRKKGDFPFYKVSDMNLPGNEKYLRNANNYVMKNDVTNKGWVIAPAGGIAFAKVGAALLLNRRRILCVDCLVDNNMMVAVAKEGCLSLWLYWWLLQVDFSIFVQPGAVPSVNQSQLKKLKISIPLDIEEQKVIVDTLEAIDKRELAERSTLSKTILLKHGLMQDLLVGNVPVVPDPQDKEYQGVN